jgi:hypothetical protein
MEMGTGVGEEEEEENCLKGPPPPHAFYVARQSDGTGQGARLSGGPPGHFSVALNWHSEYQFGGSAEMVRPAAGRSGARSGFAGQATERPEGFAKRHRISSKRNVTCIIEKQGV